MKSTDDRMTQIIVLCGFLGSGKTTLLKRFLLWEQNQNSKPAVLVSEFGDIDIDGILIDNKYINLTGITGGCACCDLREELTNALKGILRNESPDRIYLEATGVADPAGILEAIAPVTRVESAFISKVIVVYDTSRHKYFGNDLALVEKQLTTADIVIVNKCDSIVPGRVDQIIDEIRELNPTAQILPTINCVVDPEFPLKGKSKVKYGCDTVATSGTFRSFAFLIDAPVSELALKKWIASMSKSVVRVKGFVKLEDKHGYFEVQATQGQCVISSFPVYNRQEGVLVIIAHPMRTDGLVHGLQKCIAH